MRFISTVLLTLVMSISVFALNLSPKIRTQNVQYQTIPMNPGYAQKDVKKGVVYLNPAQREQLRVIIENGLVYTSRGEAYPDSINTKPEHINHINYVMDANGNFYLFNEYAHPEIRHSSIFDGGPIAGGGEIEIKSGQITYIDSDSGHYSTNSLMPNVFSELRADGVRVDLLK